MKKIVTLKNTGMKGEVVKVIGNHYLVKLDAGITILVENKNLK